MADTFTADPAETWLFDASPCFAETDANEIKLIV